MRRRQWLQLGLASTVVLAVAGGTAVMMEPGLTRGSLTESGRRVFQAAARGLLDGSLPQEAGANTAAVSQLLDRIDTLVAALPPHAQDELSQLLALLDTSAGRRLLAGLDAGWQAATVEQIQRALTSMRYSGVSLRQQAYHALHDITGAAYVSDASTWSALGYPGPLKI